MEHRWIDSIGSNIAGEREHGNHEMSGVRFRDLGIPEADSGAGDHQRPSRPNSLHCNA